MDEEHKFEGSFMEVKHKMLSYVRSHCIYSSLSNADSANWVLSRRDRLSFSKSILKRYMRECVQREASSAAPWVVKPSIAKAFGIETRQSDDVESQNKEIKDGKLAKRKKVGAEGGPAEPATKRRKAGESTFLVLEMFRSSWRLIWCLG